MWAALVTIMLAASVIANFLITESPGKGLMRLTQLYSGLAHIGYDEEADAAMPLGNALVILLLYAPAFVLYVFHQSLRKKSTKDTK